MKGRGGGCRPFIFQASGCVGAQFSMGANCGIEFLARISAFAAEFSKDPDVDAHILDGSTAGGGRSGSGTRSPACPA
jgi:hypothetical protein